MKQETVTISKGEYVRLKKKAELADDALLQIKASFEDLKHGRVSRFKSKTS